MLPFFNDYQQAQNKIYELDFSSDIVDLRILQCDRTGGTPDHTQPEVVVSDAQPEVVVSDAAFP